MEELYKLMKEKGIDVSQLIDIVNEKSIIDDANNHLIPIYASQHLPRYVYYEAIKKHGLLHLCKYEFPKGTIKQWFDEYIRLIVNEVAYDRHVQIMRAKRRLERQNKKMVTVPNNIKKYDPMTKKIINSMRKGDKYSGMINIIVDFSMSMKYDRTSVSSFNVRKANEDQIKILVNQEINKYFSKFGNPPTEYRVSYQLDDMYKIYKNKSPNGVFDFMQMKIASICYVKLPYNTNCNTLEYVEHCVLDYLINNQEKLRIKNKLKNDELKNKKEWTIEEFTDIISNNNYKIYDQDLKLRYINTCKHDRPVVMFICGNNHLYPITSTELKTLKGIRMGDEVKIKNIKLIPSTKKIIEMCNKNPITDIKYNTVKKQITSFVCDGVKYLSKNEYEVFKMYNSIGFTNNEKYPIMTNKYNDSKILKIIAEVNKLESSCCSFLSTPKAMYIVAPFDVTANEIKREVLGIDMNKAYTNILLTLKYIPVITYENYQYKYEDNHNFKETNFYHIVHVPLLYRNIVSIGSWCSGHRIKNIHDKLLIDMYIVPTLKKNPYKNIIEKMLKYDEKLTKNVINKFIGQCQIHQTYDGDTFVNYDRIVKSDDYIEIMIGNEEGYNFNNISESYYIRSKINKVSKKYRINMLPLSHYIVDVCISKTLDKIDELTDNGIIDKLIGVKTDCIFYYGKEIEGSKKPGEWKNENPDELLDYVGYTDNQNPIIENKIISEIQNFVLERNIIIDEYAGCGKTKFIIEKIIPYLDDDYYVITCQHAHKIQYKNANLKCMTLQKMKMRYKYLPAKYIIVDECGLLSNDDMEYLYKVKEHDKYYIFAGDGKQLPSVTNEINSMFNLSFHKMFDCRLRLPYNYRNSYTNKKYDRMFNGTYELTDYEKNIINRIIKTGYNICYYNETRKRINSICVKSWVDTFGGVKVKKGGRLLCKDKQNKYEKENIIYNMFYEIIDYDENKIMLRILNSDKIIELTKDKFIACNFEHGYALTLYCAQGSSIPYNEISIHDYDKIKSMTGGIYTAFSRIKDKIRPLNKQIKKPNKNKHITTISLDKLSNIRI